MRAAESRPNRNAWRASPNPRDCGGALYPIRSKLFRLRGAAQEATRSSWLPVRRSSSRSCASGGWRMSLQLRTGARGALRVRGRALEWGARTYVMGIVNVTPDSFSGDGIEEPDLA